ATEVLTPALSQSWMGIQEKQAKLAASIIARVGISFISLPPADPDDLASGLTAVVVPYLRGFVQGELPRCALAPAQQRADSRTALSPRRPCSPSFRADPAPGRSPPGTAPSPPRTVGHPPESSPWSTACGRPPRAPTTGNRAAPAVASATG